MVRRPCVVTWWDMTSGGSNQGPRSVSRIGSGRGGRMNAWVWWGGWACGGVGWACGWDGMGVWVGWVVGVVDRRAA